MDKEIEKNFTYHAPTEEKAKLYPKIRQKARELAVLIKNTVPKSREQSLAFTKLEECVMWANAGISRNNLNDKENN